MPLDHQRRVDAVNSILERLVDCVMRDDTADELLLWFDAHEPELVAGISDYAVGREEFMVSMETKA